MLAAALFSSAQWNDSSENTLVATDVQDEVFVSETSDGGVYLTYTLPSGTYIQLMDKDGRKLFGDAGMLVSDEKATVFYVDRRMLLVDREDNAIVVVSDNRLGDGLPAYTAYKVSPSGEMLWGEEGITFNRGERNSIMAYMNMLELGDGSLVFSWTVGNVSAHIELERLSPEGEFLWNAPLSVGEPDELTLYSWLVPSTDDTFNVVYTHGYDYDFVARRYNADGTPVWTDDVVIYDGGFDNQPVYTFSDFVSDGEGGVIAGWRYAPDPAASSRFKAQVACVKADGSYGFGRTEKGGIVLDDLNNENTMVKLAYCDRSDCVYGCYYEKTSAGLERLVIQKVNMLGECVFVSHGVRNEILTQQAIALSDMTVTPDGDVIVVYTYMTDTYSGVRHLRAIRLNDVNGEPVWDEALKVSEAESPKSGIAATDIVGGDRCIVSWKDKREGDANDLYVQPVYLDGTSAGIENVGEDAVNCMTASFSGSVLNVSVCVDAPEHLKVDVYDISGRHVTQLCNENVAVGVHEYNATLSTGVYVVRVATSESVISTKVM